MGISIIFSANSLVEYNYPIYSSITAWLIAHHAASDIDSLTFGYSALELRLLKVMLLAIWNNQRETEDSLLLLLLLPLLTNQSALPTMPSPSLHTLALLLLTVLHYGKLITQIYDHDIHRAVMLCDHIWYAFLNALKANIILIFIWTALKFYIAACVEGYEQQYIPLLLFEFCEI